METIILQIVSETVKKFLDYYGKNGMHNLSDMAEGFKAISDEMAKETLKALIESADEAIRKARFERMGDRIKIRESNVPRELFTVLGSFSYRRTYFDTPDGREYILDGILGVEAYERIDSGVSAGLVNAAACHSYGRSADIVTGGRVSRQSVRNKAVNTGEVAHVPEKAATTPEAIHIFADEDHVKLQNGKRAIIPLITVCGGKRPVCEGRNALIDPFHMHGYGMKPEDFWGYAYALCAEKYDMELVREIYIYGDGAAWIKVGFDVFPEAVHVLDEFHFKKRMKGLFAGYPTFAVEANAAVRTNNRSRFDKAAQGRIFGMEKDASNEKGLEKAVKKASGHAAYIMTHWEAIQNMRLPGAIGSCTEAMVSHVLSERFSRNPMGWSAEGLSKMAMVRVFVMNGGRVSPADVTAWKGKSRKHSVIEKFEKYDKIVREQHDAILKDVKNWRWFEQEDLISGKRTGTSVALSALGRTRKIS